MRNPKRINKILKLIEKIWAKNPDLRLCQLIENCFSDKGKIVQTLKGNVYIDFDIYFVEDEELEERLKKIYE